MFDNPAVFASPFPKQLPPELETVFAVEQNTHACQSLHLAQVFTMPVNTDSSGVNESMKTMKFL